jgi:hypothetical protein
MKTLKIKTTPVGGRIPAGSYELSSVEFDRDGVAYVYFQTPIVGFDTSVRDQDGAWIVVNRAAARDLNGFNRDGQWTVTIS